MADVLSSRPLPRTVPNPDAPGSATQRAKGSPGGSGDRITLYTTAWCPYCLGAKNLLMKRGLAWDEVRLDGDEAARAEMRRRTGGADTLPQVFINGRHVGGLDELMIVDHLNEWDKYLLPRGA